MPVLISQQEVSPTSYNLTMQVKDGIIYIGTNSGYSSYDSDYTPQGSAGSWVSGAKGLAVSDDNFVIANRNTFFQFDLDGTYHSVSTGSPDTIKYLTWFDDYFYYLGYDNVIRKFASVGSSLIDVLDLSLITSIEISCFQALDGLILIKLIDDSSIYSYSYATKELNLLETFDDDFNMFFISPDYTYVRRLGDLYKYEALDVGVFYGDYASVSLDTFEAKALPNILVGEDSSISFTEGVGVSVTGVAYVPYDYFLKGQTLTVLNSDNSIFSEFLLSDDSTNLEDFGVYLVSTIYGKPIIEVTESQKVTRKITTGDLVTSAGKPLFYIGYEASFLSHMARLIKNVRAVFANPNITKDEFDATYPTTLMFKSTNVKVSSIFNQGKGSFFNQDGSLLSFGYIESTTKINGVAAPFKRVLCYLQNTGALIGSTLSDKDGNYRFDNILVSEKYMLVSQYSEPNSKQPPDYAAVATDWQTPIPYEE